MIKKIELCGRVCYKSEDKITDDSAEKFIRNLLSKDPPHESVIEHEYVTVKFICDRGVSHELVRHRIGSYSQESTRYCDYSKDKYDRHIRVILPVWLKKAWDSECSDSPVVSFDTLENIGDQELYMWIESMLYAERKYMHFTTFAGWTAQQARCVLPNSLKTEIMVTYNLREWRLFFKQRCAPAAHPQMRQLTMPLLKEFKELMSVFFEDITW